MGSSGAANFFHYSPYLPLSCPVHSHPATPKQLRLFCRLTLFQFIILKYRFFYSEEALRRTQRRRTTTASTGSSLSQKKRRRRCYLRRAQQCRATASSRINLWLLPSHSLHNIFGFQTPRKMYCAFNKSYEDYKWYWKTLKDNGLWDKPTCLNRKQELGCLIDDVREVMPHCVIKDVRDRWPNPPNVPYQGHRRSWKARSPHMDRPHYSFSAQHSNVVLQLAYTLTHSYFCQWLLQEYFFVLIQSLARQSKTTRF